MDEKKLQLEQQALIRNLLRGGGAILSVAGLVFMIVGVGSFFSSFGPPQYFWCAFVGIPLLGVGGSMLSLGFRGAMQRYLAGESAPVAKDTFNYLAENAKPGVTSLTSAIRDGLKSPRENDDDK